MNFSLTSRRPFFKLVLRHRPKKKTREKKQKKVEGGKTKEGEKIQRSNKF